MVNIMLGEIIYGGIGAGMYGMLIFLVITIFFAGLMVGRTPEYLGKKIETREVQLSVLAVIGQTATILFLAAAAIVTKDGLAGSQQPGTARPLGDPLRVFIDASATTGARSPDSASTTRSTTSPWRLAMLIGRFIVIVPALALAGSLGAKTPIPPSIGTFSTSNADVRHPARAHRPHPRGLNFFPALTLGPILEHFLALKGMVF